jgi:hypothetical protein
MPLRQAGRLSDAASRQRKSPAGFGLTGLFLFGDQRTSQSTVLLFVPPVPPGLPGLPVYEDANAGGGVNLSPGLLGTITGGWFTLAV